MNSNWGMGLGLALAIIASKATTYFLDSIDPAQLEILDDHRSGSPLHSPKTANLDSTSPTTPSPNPHSLFPSPVASYTLNAILDPQAHTVKADGTLVWRNTSNQPQDHIYVHLYLNAFKTNQTVFMRDDVTGFRGTDSLTNFGSIDIHRFMVREMGQDVWPTGHPTTQDDPDDQTDIRVPLPKPVLPGESITIELSWTARLPSIFLRTGYSGSFHSVAQWFPKIARLEPDGEWAHFPFHRMSEFYADFGNYDVTISVPEAFIVGATGKLDRETRADGRVERRFVQNNVHDFAFFAWDAFLEKNLTTKDGVALRCLYPKGADRAADVQLDAAEYGLSYFGAAFGTYPYETLTLIHPPSDADEAGGMEYPTLITTGGLWMYPYMGTRLIEDITLHELAHQWFYGLVATNEHRYPFLDEGLTSYAELDVMQARYADTSALNLLGLKLSLPVFHRAFAIEVGQNGSIAQATTEFKNGGDYGGLIYARTATLLLTLGNVYGKALIRQAIGQYARKARFQHPRPGELIDAMRDVAGDEAADALHTGIFDRGWVDYVASRFSSKRTDDEQGGFEGDVWVRRRGTLVLPVDIDFYAQDGSIQRVHWDAKETSAKLRYTGASDLVAVVIDPEHRVLLDEDLSNNAYRRGQRIWAPRVFDLSSFAAGVVLNALAP